MYYKIFDRLDDAMAFSGREAMRRGCSGTTQYWWSWKMHPTDGRCALLSDTKHDETWVDSLGEDWLPDELEFQ